MTDGLECQGSRFFDVACEESQIEHFARDCRKLQTTKELKRNEKNSFWDSIVYWTAQADVSFLTKERDALALKCENLALEMLSRSRLADKKKSSRSCSWRREVFKDKAANGAGYAWDCRYESGRWTSLVGAYSAYVLDCTDKRVVHEIMDKRKVLKCYKNVTYFRYVLLVFIFNLLKHQIATDGVCNE